MLVMKRIIYIMFFFCSFCFSQSLLQQLEQEITQLTSNAKDSVVRLRFCYTANIPDRMTSGVVLDNQGHIVTLERPIRNATNIYAYTADMSKIPVKVIGADRSTNLCVLKIDSKNLKPVLQGNSEQLHVGSTVIAIGNPYGILKNSIAMGLVSGLNRCVKSKENDFTLSGLIQTTTPINPGDDGGLVIDSQGRFVGIVLGTFQRELMVESQRRWFFTLSHMIQDLHKKEAINPNLFKQFEQISNELLNPKPISQLISQDISFIIPSKRIYWISEQLIKYGSVQRAWLGVTLDYRFLNKACIQEISNQSPAFNILQKGDTIIAVNNYPITDAFSLLEFISYIKAGDTITLTYCRNNQVNTITVQLKKMPQ